MHSEDTVPYQLDEIQMFEHSTHHTSYVSCLILPLRGQKDREESKDLPETEAQWAPRLVWEADVLPFLFSSVFVCVCVCVCELV